MLKEWAWRYADIAQLVEQWICNPYVTSSILVISFGECVISCADTQVDNGKQKLHDIAFATPGHSSVWQNASFGN